MLNQAPMPQAHIPIVAHPVAHCAWCWSTLHPTLSYPASWSSTCCLEHRAWVLAQYARSRASRPQRSALHKRMRER
jgi:hypothetical protein